MDYTDRITLELGRDALSKMTLTQALEAGYGFGYHEGRSEGHSIGYAKGYGDGKQYAEALAQASQPVGGDIIAARMAKPALSAILPRRPDDVPAPPESDFVGRGDLANGRQESSDDIYRYEYGKWIQGNRGDTIDVYYAIRRNAQPDIWHRFGLLAPSEGGGFYPHTPGDPMPCAGDMRVDVLLSEGSIGDELSAGCWIWACNGVPGDIIGWRPALGGAK